MTFMIIVGVVTGLIFWGCSSMSQERWAALVKKLPLIIGCIIYILSPVDILPEAALGFFGFFDDAVALIAAVSAALDDGTKTVEETKS